MSVSDQTILAQLQRVTLEGAGDLGLSWPSGMWTLQEVLGYLNQRQNRFLAATGLMWTILETPLVLAQSAQPHPADWIATLYMAYKSGAGDYRELPRMDALEFDYRLPSWPGASSLSPQGFYEVDGATTTANVVPIPTDPGSALERYYVAMGTPLTQAGVLFSVPDEFVPTIKYGALAEMFSKVGQAANPILAEACEARWTEGVELGKLMATEGWFVL